MGEGKKRVRRGGGRGGNPHHTGRSGGGGSEAWGWGGRWRVRRRCNMSEVWRERAPTTLEGREVGGVRPGGGVEGEKRGGERVVLGG